ncbi:MAG: hypothetical protein HY581_06065 [Nitrospirae bacterium]|nr:hypothetical protein [Nitrospirota bacterium]
MLGSFTKRITCVVASFGLALVGIVAGCGTIGPPVPPEDIGIAAAVLKQQEREAKGKELQEKAVKEAQEKALQEQAGEAGAAERKAQEGAADEDDVILKDLRPIGTR